jgi:hypothetical protein
MNPEKNVMNPLPDNTTKELILSRAFFDREDLTALVQIAAKLLNNPIMIIDTTFQCLANFPEQPIGIPSWDDIITRGYMENDLVQHMGEYFSKLSEKQRNGSYFFERRESDGRLFKKIVASINYEGKNLGGIAIAEYYQPLTESDLIFSNHVCKIIGAYLQKEQFFKNNFNQSTSQLLWEILANQCLDTEIVSGRLEALGLAKAENPYYLVYIEFSPIIRENADYYIHKLKSLFPQQFVVYFQNALVIVGDFTPESYSEFIEKLEHFLASNHFSACASNPFSSLTQLREQFLLNQQAWTIGKKLFPESIFFEFAHLNLHAFLQEAENHFSIDAYLHPGIRQLIQHDNQNQTEYLPTLMAFMENNMNIAQTAAQLFIHRNTLTYRLKKIQQILGQSMNDKLLYINLLLAACYEDLKRSRGND